MISFFHFGHTYSGWSKVEHRLLDEEAVQNQALKNLHKDIQDNHVRDVERTLKSFPSAAMKLRYEQWYGRQNRVTASNLNIFHIALLSPSLEILQRVIDTAKQQNVDLWSKTSCKEFYQTVNVTKGLKADRVILLVNSGVEIFFREQSYPCWQVSNTPFSEMGKILDFCCGFYSNRLHYKTLKKCLEKEIHGDIFPIIKSYLVEDDTPAIARFVKAVSYSGAGINYLYKLVSNNSDLDKRIEQLKKWIELGADMDAPTGEKREVLSSNGNGNFKWTIYRSLRELAGSWAGGVFPEAKDIILSSAKGPSSAAARNNVVVVHSQELFGSSSGRRRRR